MNALQVMDRYWQEVIQVSTSKNDIKVQYLYDSMTKLSSEKYVIWPNKKFIYQTLRNKYQYKKTGSEKKGRESEKERGRKCGREAVSVGESKRGREILRKWLGEKECF